MRIQLPGARSLVLLTAVVLSLSGCLGDNCRPHRGWDRSDRSRGYDHDCDRHSDRHHHY